MQIEKLVDLWMHENSIANSKSTYYVGSLVVLAWPVAQLTMNGRYWMGFIFSCLGVALAILYVLSINRTLKYRESWRSTIEREDPDYSQAFSKASEHAGSTLSSKVSLRTLPLIGGLIYLFSSLYLCYQALKLG